MPELPEVETIKRDLVNSVKGAAIKSVNVHDIRVIKDLGKRKFEQSLAGCTIADISRAGKAIVLKLSPRGYLVVQLKMTGQMVYHRSDEIQNHQDAKVVFELSNGSYLTYNDQRTFGWLIYVQRLEEVPYLHSIGPDPLNKDVDSKWLMESMRTRKSPIKTLLLNQEFVSGIGNIYASEILFKAKVNPQKKAQRLSSNEINLLNIATKEILKEAIRYRGTSMNNYRDGSGKKGNFKNRIKVYGRENQDCASCGSPIKRIVQSGRSTFYCQVCQK